MVSKIKLLSGNAESLQFFIIRMIKVKDYTHNIFAMSASL